MDFKYNFNHLTKFDAGPKEISDLPGISYKTNMIGIEETKNIFHRKVGTAINAFTARAIATVGVDLLAKAQPRVPVDTGKLRESGRVILEYGRSHINIAKGTADGSISVDNTRVDSRRMQGVTEILVNVSYARINSQAQDIAVWAHEELAPFDAPVSVHPRARTEGTGPKYLELPWLANYNKYENFIKSELTGAGLERNFNALLVRKTKKVGAFTLNYNDIYLEKLNFGGYFGARL